MKIAITTITILAAAAAGCGDNATSDDTTGDDTPGDDTTGDDSTGDDSTGDDTTDPDAGGDPDAPPAGDGLRLYYAFEDTGATVTDDSAAGLDGALSDPTAWTASGRVGRALQMSAANPATQFVALPDGVLTDIDDFTIATWVRLDVESPWGRIYDIGNGLADPANRFMYLTPQGFIGPEGILASSYGGSGANELVTAVGTKLPLGVWKHLAITGSGGDRTIYIDGFPAATFTDGPDVPPLEMEPIGAQSWLGKSRFPDGGLGGTLDEFRIYDHVLTQPEVADLAAPQLDYAHWRFDEGSGGATTDSSAHAIPTVMNGDAAWTTGRLGSALSLPGTDGAFVTFGANPIADCTDELTVSAWVKLDALSNWARIFDFGSGNTAFIFLAPTDGTGTHFAMVAPSGIFDLVSTTPAIPADAAWHHVAVTVTAAGVATIYVDGASVASATSPNVSPGDFATVTENYLGKSRFPDPFLDGALDEVRIGCRALTADEIENLSRP
jgi:hypothetical protein